MIQNYQVTVTTDAAGAATAFTLPVSGRIEHVRYRPDASTPLDTGATLAISGESTGLEVLTKANIGTSAFTSVPRQQVHQSSDGSAALYAAAGKPLLAPIAIAGERLKVAITAGGNVKSGTVDIVVSDDS